VRISLDITVLAGHICEANLEGRMGELAREGIVIRRMRIVGILLTAAVSVCAAAQGQNQPTQQTPAQQAPPPSQQSATSSAQTQQQAAPPAPSLGDVARKYREEKAEKEKNGAPQGALYTNEGVIPKGGANALGIAPVAKPNQSVGGAAGRGGAGATPSFDTMMASLDTAMAQMNELAALDRATLVGAILKDNNVDFPGRADWEARLMAGRDAYVARGRQLNQAMKELLTQANALHDANPNLKDDDPRVKQLMNMVTQVTADAKKTGDDFQNLMDEGRVKAKVAHPGVN